MRLINLLIGSVNLLAMAINPNAFGLLVNLPIGLFLIYKGIKG